MDQQKIKRINELYKKSKAEGLTDAERKEQKILRQEYMELVRRNLRGQLNNIDIEQKDGTVINLGEKYGAKFEKRELKDVERTSFRSDDLVKCCEYETERFLSIAAGFM